ncbi:MAG: hypothetical protein KJZ65_13140 [Phycisphaerales bacterium]|nr:hypothetical protein [Phycisphaerales bacterium]
MSTRTARGCNTGFEIPSSVTVDLARALVRDILDSSQDRGRSPPLAWLVGVEQTRFPRGGRL